MDKETVLQQCTVDGHVIRLPDQQLDRDLYLQVAKSLEIIGGKWNRKAQGFVFPSDPSKLLSQVASGTSRNLKKEYQAFFTPDALADRLVGLLDIQEGNSILEPSAGQGSLVNAIHKWFPTVMVDVYELMEINKTFLRKLPFTRLLGDDFQEHSHTFGNHGSRARDFSRKRYNDPRCHIED
jgi:hypothetical protein